MGTLVRILTKNKDAIGVDTIKSCLERYKVSIEFKLTGENEWKQFLISKGDNEPVFIAERIDIVPEVSGFDEIENLSQDIVNCKPKSAVEWISEYLKEVNVIYAFELLSSIDNENGWEILNEVQDAIWKKLGGIFQADGEGFSNEEGFHILWQFEEGVAGLWNMAVMDDNGKWIRFEMELSNKKNVKEFFHGRVPQGVSIIHSMID